MESGHITDAVASVGLTAAVSKWLKSSVAINGGVGVDGVGVSAALSRAWHVAVGVQVLPESEETVNVGVVQEEGRVVSSKVIVAHVTGLVLATGERVDAVVDGLEGDTTAGGLLSNTIVGDVQEVGASSQNTVDLGTGLSVVVANVLDSAGIVGLSVDVSRRAWVTERVWPRVPVTTTNTGEIALGVRVHLGEGVERVGDGLLTLWRVDRD